MEIFPRKVKALLLALFIFTCLAIPAQEIPDIKALVAQLQKKESAEQAARQLQEMARKDPSTISALLQELQNSGTESRKSIVQLLGKIGDRKSAVPLAERFAGEPVDIRREIARALSRIGPPAVEGLRALCDGEQDAQAKVYLCALLYASGHNEYREPIARLLTGDEAKIWREELLENWSTSPEKAQLKQQIEAWVNSADFMPRSIYDLLRKQDAPVWLRLYCVELLGENIHKKPEIIPALLDLLDAKEDPIILRQTVAVLGQARAYEATDRIVALLAHPIPQVRQDVIFSLALLQNPKVAASLTAQFTGETSPDVKLAILKALACYKREVFLNCVGTLSASLEAEDEDPRVKAELVSLLSHFSVEGSLPQIMALLPHEDPLVRREVALALTFWKDPQIPAKLAERYPMEGSPEIRCALLRALAVHGDGSAILSALAKLPEDLSDQEPDFIEAVSDCAEIIEDRYGQKIVDDLDPGNPRIDRSAVQALLWVNDPEPVQRFNGASYRVKSAMLKILSSQENREAITAIFKALPENFHEEHPDVLSAIVEGTPGIDGVVVKDILTAIAVKSVDAKSQKYALERLLPLVEDPEVLIKLLQDDHADIRTMAFEKLKSLIAPMLTQENIAAFGYNPQEKTLARWQAAAKWERWWHFRNLLPSLADPDEQKRKSAMEFIRKQEDWVVPFLLKYYQEPLSTATRQAIVELLPAWGNAAAVAHLKSILDVPELSASAWQALVEIHRGTKTAEVRDILNGFFPKIADPAKLSYAVQLAGTGEASDFPESFQYLAAQMKTENRNEVLRLLQQAEIFPSALVPEFKELLAGDESTRHAVVEFLFAVAAPGADELLAGHFALLNSGLKQALLTGIDRAGLQKLGPTGTAPGLDDAEDAVKVAFCQAVRRNGYAEGAERLLSWLTPEISLELEQAVLDTLAELRALKPEPLKEVFARETRLDNKSMLLKALSAVEGPSPFWQTLIRSDLPEELHIQLGHIISENPSLSILASAMLGELSKKQSPTLRAAWYKALRQVASFPEPEASRVVKLVAEEKDVAAKIEAISLLGKVPYQSASSTLLGILASEGESEDDLKLKHRALEQLTAFAEDSLAEDLMALHQKAHNPAWKATLRTAIVEISPKGLPLLEEAIRQTPPDMGAFGLLAKKDPTRARELMLDVFTRVEEEEGKLSILRNERSLFGEDHVSWLLLLLTHPSAKVRAETAQILTQITGVSTDYEVDAEEVKRQNAAKPWENWEKSRKDIARLVSALLKAEGREVQTLRDEILEQGEMAIAALRKELRKQHTDPERERLVNTLSYSGISDTSDISNMLSGSPALRKEIYFALQRLGDPALGDRLPLCYWQEEDPSVRVVILDIMLDRNIDLYPDEWREYLGSKEAAVWEALLRLMERHAISGKKNALFSNLANVPEDLLGQATAILKREIGLEDLDRLALLAEEEKRPQWNKAVLELLSELPEVPKFEDVQSFGRWWQEHKAAFEHKIVLARAISELGKGGDAILQKLSGEDLKWAQERLIATFRHKTTPRDQKERILRLVSGCGDPANAEFLAETLAYEQYLFDIDMKYLPSLDEKTVAEDLSKVFAGNGYQISPTTLAVPLQEGKWLFDDRDNGCQYSIVKQEKSLSVYAEETEIRSIAAWGLYRIGYAKIPEAIERAGKHEDAAARFYAVRAMGLSGKDSVRDTLAQMAISDQDARVREEALYWAIQLKFDDREKLLQLADDRAYRVKTLAIERLAGLEEKAALSKMIEYLENEPWPQMQTTIFHALTKLSGQNIDYLPEAVKEDWTPATMEERVEWNEWWTGDRRKRGLNRWKTWWMGYQQAKEISALADLFAQEGVNAEEVRRQFAEKYLSAPEKLRPAGRDQVLELLRSPKGKIRLEMTNVIGSTKDPSWKFLLAQQLVDADIHVRHAALVHLRALVNVPVISPWAFDKEDFKDVGALVSKLNDQGPLASYLQTRFSGETREMLATFATLPEESRAGLLPLLKKDFDSLLAEPLYDKARLSQTKLSPHTQKFLDNYREYLSYTNRLILEDAYPLRQWRGEAERLVQWWAEKVPAEKVPAEEQTKKVAGALENLQNRDEVVAKLVKLGPQALDAIRGLLKDERPQVRLIAVDTLCRWRDFAAVSDMISLLEDPDARPPVRQSLKKLLGNELPLLAEDEGTAYAEHLKKWWQKIAKDYEARCDSTIVQAMVKIQSGDARVIKEQLLRIRDLGPGAREFLVRYLEEASDTGPVKNTLALALLDLEDPRAIPGLTVELRSARSGARKHAAAVAAACSASASGFALAVLSDGRAMVLSIIYALAGEHLEGKKIPATEEEWGQERERLTAAWSESQAELAARFRAALEKFQKSEAEVLKEMAGYGPRVAPLAAQLCQDKDVAMQRAGLQILQAIGIKKLDPADVGLPLLELSAGKEDVAAMAKVAVASLTSAELPKVEEVWRAEVVQSQQWWQKRRETIGTGVEVEKLEELLTAASGDKEDEQQLEERLCDLGIGAIESLPRYWNDPDDTMRCGSVRLCTLPTTSFIMTGEGLRDALLSSNTEVRRRAIKALSRLGELPAGALYRQELDDQWQRKAEEWQKEWMKTELAREKGEELRKLESDAALLLQTREIQTEEQIESARKAILYLESPVAGVSSRALEILKKFAGQEIDFDPKASLEKRQQDLKNIDEWLADIEKKIQQGQEKIVERKKEIERQWAALNERQDLITVEQCQKLMAMAKEMLGSENSHPAIQKKYLEILELNGCGTYVKDYDVYGGREKQKAILAALRSAVYDRRQELTRIAAQGVKVEEELKSLFDLKRIEDEKSLDMAQKLVDLLAHPHYPLRQKAISTLAVLCEGKDRGYRAKLLPENNRDAISQWQTWLAEQSGEMQKTRDAYLKSVAEFSTAQVDAARNEEFLKRSEFLVRALEDGDPAVRAQALTWLKAAAGQDYGYNPVLTPAEQKTALSSWSTWLEKERRMAQRQAELGDLAGRARDAGKVQTAAHADVISRLISALDDPQEKIRDMAVAALKEYAAKHDPGAPASVAKASWQEWFDATVKPVADGEQERCKQIRQWGEELARTKVKSLSQWKIASEIVASLAHEALPIRQEAIAALKLLAGVDGYQAGDSAEKRQEAIMAWNMWLKEENRSLIKQAAQNVARGEEIKTPAQVEDIELLVDGLSEALVIRNIAFDALSKYAQKYAEGPSGYDPDASETVRSEGVRQWRQWFDEKIKPIAKQENK